MSPQPATASSRRRVLLTRSEEDCADWAARFAQHGAEAVAFPCIRTEPIAIAKAELEAALQSADWLAFTSRRGVEAFAALGG